MDISIKTKPTVGAKVILETLKSLGVSKIFGYPGGMVLKIYDELYSQNEIEHILVRHEQSAVHAAEGYARTTGKVGVVLVTSGPGATNTVTGIANAYLDGFPLIVLTGQVNSELIGKNAFQEANICDITKSCTKKVYQVTDVNELQNTLIDAYVTSMSSKKGPVVVDIAKDILYKDTEFKEFVLPQQNFEHVDVKPALEKLCMAQKPVIVAGGGAVEAYSQLREFAKMLNIPVVNTMMGTGVYPYNEENYLGMVGIFGDKSANTILKESDVIFSVGARFNDRITCCFKSGELSQKIIQLDINENEISNTIPCSLALVGDAKVILSDMITEFKKGIYRVNSNWQNLESYKKENKIRVPKNNMLHSFEVLQEVQKFIAGKDITVTTEVGQHQLWAVQNLKFDKPLKFITSGGSGTMGFGLPAAMGVAVAYPDKPVLCITGDGSFQMNLHELATCKDYNLPLKILIMNNGYLGMVRQLQENQCEGRYSETKISNPDFSKIADSYGIKYYQINHKDEILPVFDSAFKDNETVIINCFIEPMEML